MSRSFRIESAQQPNNFDLIRFLLAFLVLYSHCYPLGTGSELKEPIHKLTGGQMTGGAVAVDLFFVMSGFLIAASAERSRGPGSFFRKRIARIYPGFIAAACIGLFVVLPLSGGILLGGSVFREAADFLLQTLRLQEFRYHGAFSANPYAGSLNGSLWSIQFEFWCYAGVALLLVTHLLRRRVLMLLLFAVALAVSVLFVVRGWLFGGKWLGIVLGSPQLWARLLPLYMAGVVLYLWRDRVCFHPLGGFGAITALTVACFLPWGCAALFPIAGTYLVFYVAFHPAIRLHRFGR